MVWLVVFWEIGPVLPRRPGLRGRCVVIDAASAEVLDSFDVHYEPPAEEVLALSRRLEEWMGKVEPGLDALQATVDELAEARRAVQESAGRVVERLVRRVTGDERK
jgi:hypothetical protein